MSTGLIYLNPLSVAFVRARGHYAVSSQEAWNRVFAWLQTSGTRRQVGTCYGLLHDDPKAIASENCRYDACLELLDGHRTQLPPDFDIRRLPGGAYARQRHSSSPKSLSQSIAQLLDTWTPGHGLVRDPHRPIIEVYLDDPDVVTAEHQRVDICVPVNPVG